MGKYEKLLRRIIEGGSDAGIGFDDLCVLLSRVGWSERIRGSHHIFSRTGILEKINLQRDGTSAKPYQVKQVRAVILKHGLAPGAESEEKGEE
jgi:hypothetical protein